MVSSVLCRLSFKAFVEAKICLLSLHFKLSLMFAGSNRQQNAPIFYMDFSTVYAQTLSCTKLRWNDGTLGGVSD